MKKMSIVIFSGYSTCFKDVYFFLSVILFCLLAFVTLFQLSVGYVYTSKVFCDSLNSIFPT